ncbi:MAG: T9SS type A sorting domain-containing protein [Bacteroidales bacterium]|nr:T9SS type A sorting domain-containing protein [Bacteroidales bacterium]
MAKNYVFTLGILLLLSLYCKAQVEPFTRTYDIYPDWTGEFLVSIEKTNDDGYIVAYNQNEWFDVRTSILKLDKYGEVEWHRVLDEEEFPEATSYSVCVDSNNNYYLAGYFAKYYYPTLWKDQNGFVAKYNSNGDYLWGKTYGSMPLFETDSTYNAESVYDIVSYDSNTLIVAGQENYCPEREIQFFGMPWIFAIDTDGNLLWEWNNCNDTVNWFGNFYGLTTTVSGNIVAVGDLVRHRILDDYDSPMDNIGFIGVYNNQGVLQKRKEWNFLKNVSIFYDVKTVFNDEIAIVAYTADTLVYEVDKKERMSVIVFDEELEERFQYNINVGGQGGSAKISVDKDTNIFIVGVTSPSLLYTKSENTNNMLIAKFDKNADLIWKKFVGGENYRFALSQMDVVADNDGGASFCSYHANLNLNIGRSYLYKVNENGEGIFPISTFLYPDDDEYIIYNQNPIETIDDVAVYPNPARDYIIIELSGNERNTVVTIFDLFGKEIINTNLNSEHYTIDVSMLKPGVYLVKTQSGLRSKFIKL